MHFSQGDILHVYNRGNNKQQIFFTEGNYRFFLGKVRLHLLPVADILAYCLMPNHFHFLLYVNEHSCKEKTLGNISLTALGNGFRLLQSTYAAALNNQRNKTGSLFQQRAKFKLLENSTHQSTHQLSYAELCFQYIHFNPVKANLTKVPEDWIHSSYNEYFGGVAGICNKAAAANFIDINRQGNNNFEQPENFERIFL